MNINSFSILKQSNLFNRDNSGIKSNLTQFADKAKVRAGEIDKSPQVGFIDEADNSRWIRFMLAVADELKSLAAKIDIFTNDLNSTKLRAGNEIASYEAIIEHIKSGASDTDIFRLDTITARVNRNEPWQAERFNSYAYVGMSQQKREELINHIRNSSAVRDTWEGEWVIPVTSFGWSGSTGPNGEIRHMPFSLNRGFVDNFTAPSINEFNSDDIISNEIAFWQSAIDETKRFINDAKDVTASRVNSAIGAAVWSIMIIAKFSFDENIDLRLVDRAAFEAHFERGNRGEPDLLGRFIIQNKRADALISAFAELRVSGATLFDDVSNLRSSINNIFGNTFGRSLNSSRFDARV